ncbi:hypothetical protein ACIO3R_30545 [Streptomyces sp. NPDC087428]|uniref:hypothetical protein n=1 Tax=Streptomyces sp. NPDC087428 TaxID=3365788 RepID=UPI0037F9FF5B
MSAVIEVHHLHKKYGDIVAVDDMHRDEISHRTDEAIMTEVRSAHDRIVRSAGVRRRALLHQRPE